MIFTCRYCGEKVERNQSIYANYICQHPLWLHLEQCHEDLFEMMCDFENPYRIEELYDYDADELRELYRHTHSGS